jgi:hypothetical protein
MMIVKGMSYALNNPCKEILYQVRTRINSLPSRPHPWPWSVFESPNFARSLLTLSNSNASLGSIPWAKEDARLQALSSQMPLQIA